MKYQFFTITTFGFEQAQDDLNRFLASRRICKMHIFSMLSLFAVL